MGEPQPRAPASATPATRPDVARARIEAALAGALVIMAILWLLNVPRWFGLALFTEQYMAMGLGLAFGLLFLSYDARGVRRADFRPFDAALALGGLAAGGYLALGYPVLVVTLVARPLEGIVLATAMVALTAEGVRRATGLALALVIVGFIVTVWVKRGEPYQPLPRAKEGQGDRAVEKLLTFN